MVHCPRLELWHNPSCSKSREALARLADRGVTAAIIDYLRDPPSAARIEALLRKLGGDPRALVLEFSQVKPEWFRPVYDFHSFQVLPRLGRLFAGDADSYRYLAESIRVHPDQAALKGMMKSAGFGHVDVHNLAGGVVALHVGIRC